MDTEYNAFRAPSAEETAKQNRQWVLGQAIYFAAGRSHIDTGDIIPLAQKFYDFVEGTK
jgi:hypothetical protein